MKRSNFDQRLRTARRNIHCTYRIASCSFFMDLMFYKRVLSCASDMKRAAKWVFHWRLKQPASSIYAFICPRERTTSVAKTNLPGDIEVWQANNTWLLPLLGISIKLFVNDYSLFSAMTMQTEKGASRCATSFARTRLCRSETLAEKSLDSEDKRRTLNIGSTRLLAIQARRGRKN